MLLGELLVGRGFLTPAGIDAGLVLQSAQGGRLGANLINLGLLTPQQLSSVVNGAPAIPSSLAATDISPRNLINLMLKLMHLELLGTPLELAQRMKLPRRIIQQLLDEAMTQRYVQSMGAAPGGNVFSIRYALGEQGKAAARDALEQNLYLGPAPVGLAAYHEQIQRQRVSNELLTADSLRQGFEGLVVSQHYLDKLLPAINAGRTVLLFGPPGNGKTTLARRIGNVFRDIIYIPYAVEVSGELIKIFDPSVHKPSSAEGTAEILPAKQSLQSEGFDERWVACKRPTVIAGGELTIDMLDLRYNPDSKFYDAPLHVKALNGMFLIDDFGRQKFEPRELLNRWIVPMESRIDYLRLNSGTAFSLPFDELVIFSTNLNPADLMDPAFLRRIPYKVKLFAPSLKEYRQIFDGVAAAFGLALTKPIFDFVLDRLGEQFGLAYYQPNFICQQVIDACRSLGRPAEMTEERVAAALANLYFDIEDAMASTAAA